VSLPWKDSCPLLPDNHEMSLRRLRGLLLCLRQDKDVLTEYDTVFEKDRGVLRFLWVDENSKRQPETIALRFARVIFGVTCSPFLFKAHNSASSGKSTTRGHSKANEIFYVDDVVTGAHA
jgi:hypothetical protein